MMNTEGKSVVGMMLEGRMVSSIMTAGKIIWQAIQANFLTKDGFYIITKDGKIFNAKE